MHFGVSLGDGSRANANNETIANSDSGTYLKFLEQEWQRVRSIRVVVIHRGLRDPLISGEGTLCHQRSALERRFPFSNLVKCD
jgi:hypothetical protein